MLLTLEGARPGKSLPQDCCWLGPVPTRQPPGQVKGMSLFSYGKDGTSGMSHLSPGFPRSQSNFPALHGERNPSEGCSVGREESKRVPGCSCAGQGRADHSSGRQSEGTNTATTRVLTRAEEARILAGTSPCWGLGKGFSTLGVQ